MKGFSRKEPMFSLCGLNCVLCAMHVGDYCPGCGGGEGNQSCAIARCSLGRGVEFCADCAEYPCARYEGFDDADSFVPHSRRRADLERARELGLEAYISELREKAELLSELLAGYNDGRRKSLFCTAAYLLPLPDLREVLQALRALPKQPIKGRADSASALLKAAAEKRGISLKLVKKPKSRIS